MVIFEVNYISWNTILLEIKWLLRILQIIINNQFGFDERIIIILPLQLTALEIY